MSTATFDAIRSVHIESVLKIFKGNDGKPMLPGLRYLFPYTVENKIMFACKDSKNQPTGRSMCVIVAGVNPVEDCTAFGEESISFPFPPDTKTLGPGWWSVSIFTDDTVPDELFEKRLKSAIELLEGKAETYMRTSGFDEDWRAERDGVTWRVALEKDLPELLKAHTEAHEHINGYKHPHPMKPPVVLTLVAEKDGKILGGMYVEAVAEVTMIGTSAEAFATIPVLDHDVRAMLSHRAFRIVQTRVVPEAQKAMQPIHEAVGFDPDPSAVLRQRV